MLTNGNKVIREKATGRVFMEVPVTFPVDKINTEKYEAVPILQHLRDVNNPATLAYQAARNPR